MTAQKTHAWVTSQWSASIARELAIKLLPHCESPDTLPPTRLSTQSRARVFTRSISLSPHMEDNIELKGCYRGLLSGVAFGGCLAA